MSGRNNSSEAVQRRPPLNSNLPREKLPKDLQKIVDDEETLFDQIYDGR
jgi:hypothetical protein